MSTEKFSGGNSVRELIAAVAGPRQWSDTRESWLARAARGARLPYRTIKALWYGEITDVNHRSARLLRDAAEKYENIASALNQSDAEFHCADIAALLDMARKLRDVAEPEDADPAE